MDLFNSVVTIKLVYREQLRTVVLNRGRGQKCEFAQTRNVRIDKPSEIRE